jgi:hypothetical protein
VFGKKAARKREKEEAKDFFLFHQQKFLHLLCDFSSFPFV